MVKAAHPQNNPNQNHQNHHSLDFRLYSIELKINVTMQKMFEDISLFGQVCESQKLRESKRQQSET